MAANAGHQFQKIPELLELVLLELPPQTVLQYQRVCHAWKSVINTSPRLLRALWYEPSAETCVDSELDSYPRFSFNPLLTYLGLLTLRTLSDSISKTRDEGKNYCAKLWSQLNNRQHGYSPSNDCNGADSGPAEDVMVIGLSKRIDDTPGSWTTMLALQPPTRWITIYVLGPSAPRVYLVRSAHIDGLRLGELMAVLVECQERRALDNNIQASQNDPMCAYLLPGAHPFSHNELTIKKNERFFASLPGSADVKVTISTLTDWNQYPAFALRRNQGLGDNTFRTPVGSGLFKLTKQDYVPQQFPILYQHTANLDMELFQSHLIHCTFISYSMLEDDESVVTGDPMFVDKSSLEGLESMMLQWYLRPSAIS